MIRIVHILTSFDIGGAEQLVLDLCRRMDRTKFDPSVVAVVRGGPLRAEFHDAGIPTEVFEKRTRLGLEILRPLATFLRSMRPAIVHTHGFGGDTWGRIAARRAATADWQPRILSTAHNTDVDEGFVKRLVKRRLATRTDRIVAVSEAVRRYSMQVDGIDRDRIVVIPNGVDVERFRPAPSFSHEGVRFVSVGRLVPQKGHDILIDAFAMLRDALPRATLTIIGDGPLHASLASAIASYHLAGRVQLLGFRRDLPDLLTRSDVAVFPSRYEGFGIAAIEASACGLPVIASSVGGLQEAVVDQETGILVPAQDPVLLADAMRDLANDRTRRTLLGHAGRRHVERNFDIRKVAARYEALAREVLR